MHLSDFAGMVLELEKQRIEIKQQRNELKQLKKQIFALNEWAGEADIDEWDRAEFNAIVRGERQL